MADSPRPDFTAGFRKVTRSLAHVADEQEEAAQRQKELARKVDDIGLEVERLADQARGLKGVEGALVEIPVKYRRSSSEDPRVKALRAEAERGAHAFSFEWRSDGSAMVSVNHSENFQLPRLIAVLLMILASKTGSESGHLVGWKSRKQVLARISERADKENYGSGALNQLMLRFWKILDAQGVNRYLLQTGIPFGLRFALRLEVAPGHDEGWPPAG